MKMFCYQCQETAHNEACTELGVCGKNAELANLQDSLIHLLKAISQYALPLQEKGFDTLAVDRFICESLFMTITNANFDSQRFVAQILEAQKIQKKMHDMYLSQGNKISDILFRVELWQTTTKEEMLSKSKEIGILSTDKEDIRSLRELLIYGLKGLASYMTHASQLGFENKIAYHFVKKALTITLQNDMAEDELIGTVMECGENGIKIMALLDRAHNERFGRPIATSVNIGVGKRPGILISGHDLKDLEELLKQTEKRGVDVYTHCEMLPGHYYPEFRKYEHFVGNYGNAWWKQTVEFEHFNGPILFTTNCIVPPKRGTSYFDRIYTTGSAGYEGTKHIADRKENQPKDFSSIIEHALKCAPPDEIETGMIKGGYAHHQVARMSQKILEAFGKGELQKFVVMAGCDGRMKNREYYTKFANALPKDTIILVAGCAKYRFNKLELGEINGIPRLMDAGQCNDSFSIILTAIKLKELMHKTDLNDLPIVYNLAWYEQKSVIVLLSLLALGIKNIHIGPTLPAFLSHNILSFLQKKFGLECISSPTKDMERFKIKVTETA